MLSLLIPDEIVVSKIYLIRNQKVMLDDDLAELYQVDTRRLNEQVKRNISRFPEDFMFRLGRVEWGKLDVAKCDIKLGRAQKNTIRLYRTRCIDVIQCAE